ncbi:MAG: amidase [Alphaproteobacteria bacterium]|nr:amidase [Alphaproteobacteria bacterium]
MRYDPKTFRGLTFHDALPAFRDGSDSPRVYLERCLEVIEAREPVLQALVATDIDGAREAADASAERWRTGRPLSPVDGMPVGIKDLLETRTMPTEMGCKAYRGNFPKRDNAAVAALREAGALILAKTVTAELGGAHPGPTTNPFDPARTPGGSSSGSAAAVAAGMLPAAIGSQVGGSIIRPAGYCGNVALKPSRGAINRGERQASSQSVNGVHANSIEDMWRVAAEIAKRAGGDPGHRGLSGPADPPPAEKPGRLLALEGAGWSMIDDTSKEAFHSLLESVEAAGVSVLRPADDPALAALDAELMGASAVCYAIIGWESRWLYRSLANMGPDAISFRARRSLDAAEAMSVSDYHAALAGREAAQAAWARALEAVDGALMLSCPGPAHCWAGDRPGEPPMARPTGDAVFNTPASILFAPAVSMPLMAVGGLPVGVQVMGGQGADARMTGFARWLLEAVEPVVIG